MINNGIVTAAGIVLRFIVPHRVVHFSGLLWRRLLVPIILILAVALRSACLHLVVVLLERAAVLGVGLVTALTVALRVVPII